MKKVLFLMFLLLLMSLGAASVKAQVRIGGNAAPNAAAVLDLNADDANAGTKGLALPRVSLTNVSTPLTGTPVVNGMMVYNTNKSTTGGSGVGIYYWIVDSSKWVKVINSDFTVSLSKIQTTKADSGMYLVGDGAGVQADSLIHWRLVPGSFTGTPAVSATLTTEYTITLPIPAHRPLDRITFVINGVVARDYCIKIAGDTPFWVDAGTNNITMISFGQGSSANYTFQCYRASV